MPRYVYLRPCAGGWTGSVCGLPATVFRFFTSGRAFVCDARLWFYFNPPTFFFCARGCGGVQTPHTPLHNLSAVGGNAVSRLQQQRERYYPARTIVPVVEVYFRIIIIVSVVFL